MSDRDFGEIGVPYRFQRIKDNVKRLYFNIFNYLSVLSTLAL
mgnify:CR=1 FL=1